MKITLVPFCGLGNRLNVLSCAIALKEKMGYDITVHWDNSNDCHCDFTDIFLPLEGIPVVPLKKFSLVRRWCKFFPLPVFIRKFTFDACFKARKIFDSDILLAPGLPYEKIYIEGNRRFCPVDKTGMLSRFFVLTPELEKRVDAITAQFGTFTVGVHIRRTDHKVVIRDNPTDTFIQRMHEQERLHPGCKFYIASDDPEMKEQMCQLFPGRIITQPGITLSRDDLQGMKDAVVELFTLGRTNLIIGSKGSTYSELASKLYDAPLI